MHSRRADTLRVLAAAALAFGALAHARAQGDADGPTITVPGAAPPVDAAPAPAPVIPAAPAPAAAPADPRAQRVVGAIEKLRVDPLLSGKHVEHRPEWKGDKDDKPKPKDKKPPQDQAALDWILSAIRFINESSRFLFWGLVVLIVAIALVSARHLVQVRGLRRRAKGQSAVSHVRDLDVRPESLPDDVGAAAWALWQAGKVPAALSLLYRGTLSRLIHQFLVPITASATEGECLDLARPRLDASALRYVTQVVRAWEASIYGGRALSLAMGEALCTGFASRLDGRATATAGEEA